MTTQTATRAIGEIRRYYDTMKAPICSTSRARADITRVLNDRKAIQRAGEALMNAAAPFSGDPTLAAAIAAFTATLEGRVDA